MDGVIKRNRTMFRLSIIALVLFVICIGLTYLIMAMGFEAEQWMLFSSGILGEVAHVAFLIGYVAVYVLWTPDNEGNVRKSGGQLYLQSLRRIQVVTFRRKFLLQIYLFPLNG